MTTAAKAGMTTTEAQRLKVIGYIRVSTLKQGQTGYGLNAQRDALEKYCAAKDYDLVTVIPDIMSSRKVDQMYGRAAAVAAIDAGLADALLVKTLDRASRSMSDSVNLFDQAKQEGWRLLSTDDLDSSDEGQEFMNHLRMAFAHEERKKISERTKAGLQRARREGKQLGRPSTITPALAERIVAMRMREGLGAKAIATRLTEEGVPAPSGGTQWHYSTVRGVFAREGVA